MVDGPERLPPFGSRRGQLQMLCGWDTVKCFLLRFQEDCDDIRAGGDGSATQSVTLVAAETRDADRSSHSGNVLPRLNMGAATQTRIATEQSDARPGGPFTTRRQYLPDGAAGNASTKTGIAREQSDDVSTIGKKQTVLQANGTKTSTNVKAEAIDQDPSTRGNYFLPRSQTDHNDLQ